MHSVEIINLHGFLPNQYVLSIKKNVKQENEYVYKLVTLLCLFDNEKILFFLFLFLISKKTIILREEKASMGPRTSKNPQLQTQLASSTAKETYQSNVRAYVTWGHGAPLASSDSARFATKELQNFQKHHQTTSLPVSQISTPREKAVTPSLNHYEEKQKPKFGIEKSQSTANIGSKTTLVTAEQLLYGKSKERNKSPSQISRRSDHSSTVSKSSSSSTVNQMSSKVKRKNVPNNFTFVSINPKDLKVKNDTKFFLQYISCLTLYRMLEKLEKVISVLFIMQSTKKLMMLQ
jgi:hypothetical protein